jgi:thioredoxin-dependent peroxiredoxin
MDELRMPEEGEAAPQLSRPTATGGTFDLADHRGQWVVVYFYPKANTPG